MELLSSFIFTHLLLLSISTFSFVHCITNQGCRGIPKDEAEGIRCFLESDNPTAPVTRIDCSLNFNPEDKIRFQCDKFYKAVGLAGLEEEKKQEEEDELENQHGGDFWRVSKCLGGDEWDSLNSTVSLIDFRCELDKGFFDTADKSALISGGVEVAPTLMPWMTAIFQEERYICGGTLIDLPFVLTAAHCTALNDSVGIGSSPPDQFTVVLGSSSGIFSQATDLKLNPHAQIFKGEQSKTEILRFPVGRQIHWSAFNPSNKKCHNFWVLHGHSYHTVKIKGKPVSSDFTVRSNFQEFRDTTDKRLTSVVVQISNHPNYTGAPTYLNDIAILQLEKKVQPTRFALAAAFPKKVQIRSIERGDFVLQVNGFGIFSNESSGPSAKLLATNVTTKNYENCEKSERKFDRMRQFCAVPTSGDQSESGICKGDSGSGAYVKDGRIGRERWSIQGLVSFGTSMLFKGCYNVTFFTKVEFYKSWIDEEKARLAQQFRYGQDVEKPPKVEVTFERGNVNLINSTFTIVEPLRDYLTVASTVFITCLAPYPIKFVYDDSPFLPTNLVILQDDNNFVTYKDFYETSTYIFKIRATFGFHEFARHINFSCESIDAPKRRQLIEFSDDDWDEEESQYRDLTYKLHPQGKDQNLEKLTKDSPVVVSSDPCKAFFYFEEVEDPVLGFPTYRFHCQRADGSPGKLKQISCPTRAKCQNYFGTIGQLPKNCWRKADEKDSVKKDGAVTDFNFIPFIPICLPVKKYGENPENEISLPVFYSLPNGFNSRPDIYFEGLQAGQEAPELFRNFSQLSRKGQQSMIQMKNFGHRHLLNSVVQVVCQTSHYWIARSFQFAVQLANETDPRLLPVDENTDYDVTLNSNIQVAHITLNDTRIESVLCFGGIENTRSWLYAARPVKVFENEWDLLEADRQCSSKYSQKPEAGGKDSYNTTVTKNMDSLPKLRVVFEQSGALNRKEVKPGGPPLIVKRFPRFGTIIRVQCEAQYPIQIVQHILDETSYHVEESIGVSEFVNPANYTDRYFEVDANFFYGTSGQGRIIRCESLENPSDQSALEYSYSKRERLLNISAVDDRQIPAQICTEGTEVSKNDCEAIFYYEERKDFPFFGFRCEFPFGRIGEVKIHPCDSPAHCLNLYKNRRQSSKCWRKSAGCCPIRNPCPGLTKNPFCQGKNCSTLIVPSTHRPFVATCSRGTPSQPGYEETVWGSFAHFAGIPLDDRGNGSRAKLNFGDWSEAEGEQDSLIYMEPFPRQQTLGNTVSVTCRVSKYYAYDLIQFAVELKRSSKQKMLDVRGMSYYGQVYRRVADDRVRFWSQTHQIKLDNPEIERIYCFGRSVVGSRWLNVSRPISFENLN